MLLIKKQMISNKDMEATKNKKSTTSRYFFHFSTETFKKSLKTPVNRNKSVPSKISFDKTGKKAQFI